MFGLVTTFLAGPYGFLLKIAAVMAVIGGIYLYGRHAGVESMRPKLAEAESNAALWESTAENRLKLMQVQNAAVEGLRAAQKEKLRIRDEKLAKALIEADKWRDTAERRADLLANLELPENECKALVTLVDTARGM